MLTLILGKDWTANRTAVMGKICRDISEEHGKRVLIVPELISHKTERILCQRAGATSCRYAEVLSFTRLAKRVSDSVGHGAPDCLDNGGRVVAMAAAINQVKSRLKFYASVGTKPEFISEVLDGIDEFKRCCISSADLMDASRRCEGAFAQKLEELALLLESYDSICAASRCDPRDQMSWVLSELEESDYASEHVFYVDGFPDFTRQHMAILEHLIVNSQDVTISLNCDVPGSRLLAFEKAGDTAQNILRIAKKHGIAVKIETVQCPDNATNLVAQGLFQGVIPEHARHCVKTAQYDSVHEECNALAEHIYSLVRNGCRFRDICISCPDIGVYKNVLRSVFGRCNIPVYLSGNDDLLEKPVIKTVLTAIDAAVSGFDREDVLRYARSVLSPINSEQCDVLENYVILWGINGKDWLREWTKHPDGLEGIKSPKADDQLLAINEYRARVVEPLQSLQSAFRKAKTVSEQIVALYNFLEHIHMAERLEILAQQLDSKGDNRNAQILNQLWEILISALEQMYDVMGHTSWDDEYFTRLMKLLISQYSVGTIPTVLDAVTVGPITATRCEEVKHSFVLGALEGSLPAYGNSGGILTDPERNALRSMGVPLTGGADDGLQISFSEIYGVFCGAKESVFVSCPNGQPSFVFKRLQELSKAPQRENAQLGAALYNDLEAAAYLARIKAYKAAIDLGIKENFDLVQQKVNFTPGLVSEKNVRSLYGDTLKLSASQIDKYADCRMSYFLKYGLRAKERKEANVDPAEFGTYVHDVLEHTAKDVVNKGGFSNVTKEEVLEIAAEYSAAYVTSRFGDLDSKRVAYLLSRNTEELSLIVAELWEELHDSDFAPVLFELKFGGQDADVPAIEIHGKHMDAIVRGFVDRVDVWDSDKRKYVRVVDYKTGKKDFDYCDVFNGLGLQMLLYLFALKRAKLPQLGESPTPAGVQYFPARVPLVSAEGMLDDETAALEREKLFKRKGLLLNDNPVLNAMDPSENLKRLSIKRKKDGTLTGDLANLAQFEVLESYIYKILGRMVDQIALGDVQANPYTRGASHNACWFCPYASVCHAEDCSNRRNYEKMSAERFWDEIGKEMNGIG